MRKQISSSIHSFYLFKCLSFSLFLLLILLIGDGVPRYPTVIALPLERRPIFPTGVLPYRLKHPTLIESITSAVKEGHPYVGLFLRKHDLDKFSRFEEDAVLSQQDVIKKASEIHQVGVFAQIHNLFHADDGMNSLSHYLNIACIFLFIILFILF